MSDSDRLRVLRVIATLNPEWGGPMEGVRQMTRAMNDAGHHVEVACLDAPGSPWLEDLPFRVHPMGPSVGKYRYTPRLVPWLRSYSLDFDVVVSHGTWQYQSYGTWRALHDGPVPYVLYPHGALESWSLNRYPIKGLKKRVYWRLFESKVLRDARAVFFTCQEELELARSAFRPFRCNPRVVKYGTAGPSPSADAGAQRRAFFARFPELQGRRLLLFLGRIHPQKGCDMLIRAFAATAAKDDSYQLVLAGPDFTNWVPDLKALAQSLGISDLVSWPGMLSGDLKWGAFRASEASCLPSYFDSFGISVVEALACETPVLISNRVGIWREIVEDGAGLAEPPTDEGTANCLARWMAMSGAERDAMKVQARRTFEDRFRVQEAAESVVATFRSIGIGSASRTAAEALAE